MPTFIKRNREVEGPFTDAELRQKLVQGAITPQTPAWQMGMPEWKTVAAFLPDAGRKPGPPPLPVTSAPASAPPPLVAPENIPATDLRAAMQTLNSVLAELPTGREQPDALNRLEELAGLFLSLLQNRLGRVARPNQTFYAYRVVTTAIQRLRLDLLRGASLTDKGEEFVALASSYLALIAVENWRRRGLRVTGVVRFSVGAPDNILLFAGERVHNGAREVYAHDFLNDMHLFLLKPKQMFPSIQGRYYALDSLTLPSPEYLYQYGVHLLQSPHARGNWPTSPKVGGLDEDFAQSRNLLVDDLHKDCGLPLDDAALRQLSWWIVFPPYGWDMNDGGDYNMMTLVDQISLKKVVPLPVGIEYLRALSESQSLDIRNLAARCLMIYRVPPRDRRQSSHYQQAMASRDWDMALAAMAKYQARLENVQPNEIWHAANQRERLRWLEEMPPVLSQRTTAEQDPDYKRLGQMPPEGSQEAFALIEGLAQRYPNDWIMQMIFASQLMAGPDPAGGEAKLRRLIQDPPDCNEGHSRLGTLLKRQGRLNEAMEIFEDEVRRWPWNHRAVDSCLWLVTEGMTRAPD